jgi:hypothetical protein
VRGYVVDEEWGEANIPCLLRMRLFQHMCQQLLVPLESCR